jgi:predicted transcriptional regulator
MQTGDEVLENKIRRMVFNLISEYPGVSQGTIRNVFELTESGLRYHLNFLEKNNKISSSMKNGIKCFMPHSSTVFIPNTTRDILESYNLTPGQELIVTTIMRYPGIKQKDLITRTGIQRSKVIRNLKALDGFNLIKNTKYQNTVCYEYIPDDEMRYNILNGFIEKFLNNEIDEATFLKLKRRLE